MMKATRIKWDVDNEEDLEFLPDEIIIPEELTVNAANNEKLCDIVSDYISDVSGYCHKGFIIEKES